MSANGVYPRSCETVKGKILNQIVCGKRRFIGEKNEKLDFNPPNVSDKGCIDIALYSTFHYWFWYFDSPALSRATFIFFISSLSTSSRRCRDSWVGLTLWICRLRNVLHTGLKSFPSPWGFHWVSRLIHLTRIRRFGWVTMARIIKCRSF